MPPKRPGGTNVSTKKKRAKGSRGRRCRDFAAELVKDFGEDGQALQAEIDAVDMVHTRPMNEYTLINIDRCRTLYLVFLTWYYKDEAKALATLEKGAKPLPMPFYKVLVRLGASKLGESCWSLTTARTFVRLLNAMHMQHLTVAFSPEEKYDLFKYVEHLAKVDNIIPTTITPTHGCGC